MDCSWPKPALGIALLAGALLAGAAGRAWSAPPVAGVVRDDWYFRESLAAIRGWEATLARLESAVPNLQGTPVFPVPDDGRAIEWLNPVPPLLRPAEDRGLRVQVSLVGGKIAVERNGPGGKPQRETVAGDRPIVGYHHPGGGGHDQWYHGYQRRFDRLTTFRPKAAPFALELAGPSDFARGDNELALTLRNVTGRPLACAVRLDLHGPKASRSCGRESVTLSPGQARSLRFSFKLDSLGGRSGVLPFS
jgi:hypothetical protein